MCHFAVREPINQPFTTSLAQKKRRWSVMDVHHGTDVLESTFLNSHIHHYSDSYTRLPGAASYFPLFALLLLFFSLFSLSFFPLSSSDLFLLHQAAPLLHQRFFFLFLWFCFCLSTYIYLFTVIPLSFTFCVLFNSLSFINYI